MRTGVFHWQKKPGRDVDGQLARLIASVLLVPYLLLALVPTGYMPDVSPDGHFNIVICTANGPQSVALTEDGGVVPDDERDGDTKQSVDGLCAFSMLAAQALPASADLAAVPVVSGSSPSWPARFQPVSRPSRLPLGARAPPAAV